MLAVLVRTRSLGVLCGERSNTGSVYTLRAITVRAPRHSLVALFQRALFKVYVRLAQAKQNLLGDVGTFEAFDPPNLCLEESCDKQLVQMSDCPDDVFFERPGRAENPLPDAVMDDLREEEKSS